MHLVDEQDHFTFGMGDFVQHRLQAFLEFTAVLRTGDQGTHIQRHQLLVGNRIRNVTIDDAQGQTFGNRGLTHTGVTNQNRVILGPARQNLHRAANFIVATDNRVDLALTRRFGQVASIFLERVITFLGTCGIGSTTFTDFIDSVVQTLRRHSASGQRILGLGFNNSQRSQKPFDRYETVTGFGGHLFGLVQNLAGLGIHI